VLQAEKISAGFGVYVSMVKSGLELYLQFSGYSDIAIGFAMLLGFRIMENFNFPFLAKNISDFWQRWHISLTSWCREYVYMGTVAVTRNPALGAVASMLVMGLWHECSLRYIAWGVFQGLGIAVWQKFQDVKPRLPTIQNPAAKIVLRVLSTLLTVHWVLLGILLVTNGTLPQAFETLKILFTGWGSPT
jgi:D-alanyl-lipoteichoic acid acyltransferase DltB (MBOAT superfamily)